MEGLLLDLPCIRWKRFNRKWIDVNWSNYVWITVYLTCLKSFCGQKTTIWSIIGAFKAFKVAIYCILTLHQMNTFQPETDRGKSVKLFLDNCFPAFYKVTSVWTENSNLTIFWCIQGGTLPLQQCTRWTHFSRKWTEVDWSNYVGMTVCLTFTN